MGCVEKLCSDVDGGRWGGVGDIGGKSGIGEGLRRKRVEVYLSDEELLVE